MNGSDPAFQSFVVKIWLEETVGEAGRADAGAEPGARLADPRAPRDLGVRMHIAASEPVRYTPTSPRMRVTEARMSERDLVGYGATPPRVRWPNGARIAISLVVNYEEGSENLLQDGIGRRELMGESMSPVPPDRRDLANESFFEYGSRAEVWRLMRIFRKHAVRATFFACAVGLERNPAVGRAIADAGHDVLGHGNRWEEYYLMDREAERRAIQEGYAAIERLTGQAPAGWYCRYGPSENTRELVVEHGGFVYDSNSYADDLPYYTTVKTPDGERPWLVVPYSLTVNDSKFWRGGLLTGDDFYQAMKETFETLYEEGAETPKLMNVGLHCRIVGQPGRANGLDRFIAYAKAHPNVWFAGRADIARTWLEQFPPEH